MNIKIGIVALTFVALVSVSCSSTENSVKWVDYGDNPMANPEFMNAWMALGSPGPEHAHMAEFTGNWNVAGKMWMGPGQEPSLSTGTSTTKMILGGRFMQESYHSEFEGQPYEGMLIEGYDNMTKEYFTTWMDTMNTSSMTSRGTRDANGVLNMKGMIYDLSTPEGRPMRMTVTEHGKNKIVLNMYDTTPEGEEYESMQMTYTRR